MTFFFPPLVGKIPDNSGLFLVEGFPNSCQYIDIMYSEVFMYYMFTSPTTTSYLRYLLRSET